MRQVFTNNGALERTFLRLREDLKRVGHRGLAPVIGARSLAVVFSRPRTFLMTFCSQVASVVSLWNFFVQVRFTSFYHWGRVLNDYLPKGAFF